MSRGGGGGGVLRGWALCMGYVVAMVSGMQYNLLTGSRPRRRQGGPQRGTPMDPQHGTKYYAWGMWWQWYLVCSTTY